MEFYRNFIGIGIRLGRCITYKNGCLPFLVFKFCPFDFIILPEPKASRELIV